MSLVPKWCKSSDLKHNLHRIVTLVRGEYSRCFLDDVYGEIGLDSMSEAERRLLTKALSGNDKLEGGVCYIPGTLVDVVRDPIACIYNLHKKRRHVLLGPRS
jgi:hypothetical protein